MTTTYVTPAACRGRVVELARKRDGRRLYRKQVLPFGELNYQGRTLRFDRDTLQSVRDAFERRAFDHVPVQLATPSNEHNNDPQLTRGLVEGLELIDGDGLYATVSMSDEGAQLVKQYPELGVSVRLVEDFANGRGEHFDQALQHVLATWDPRINGMGPWEPVDLSNTRTGPVIDLSGLDYARLGRKGGTVPRQNNGSGPRTYTAAEVRALLENSGVDVDSLDLERDDDGTPSDKDLEALADEFFGDLTGDDDTDGDAGDAGAGAEGGDDADAGEDADEGADARELVEASRVHQQGIDLAHSRGDRLERQVYDLTAERNRERWQSERARWINAGIPPHAVDLARPAIEHGAGAIELSNGQQWDAAQAFRDAFQTIVKCGGLVDLSRSVGTAYDGSADGERNDERERLVQSLTQDL